jgi:predicted acylesterase/phospholipase RssA
VLPSNRPVVDNSGIRHVVEAALDDALIAETRTAHGEDRQLLVGATNPDDGRLQYWDVTREATELAAPRGRVLDVLMAATAIPGPFPAVELDGNLHADGGAVQGIPAIGVPPLPLLQERWQAA